MDFTVSTVDASFDSIENLYTAPVKTVGRRVRVATLAFCLIVSAMNDETYGAEHYSTNGGQETTVLTDFGRHFYPNTQYTDVPIKLNKEVLKVQARPVSASWQRLERMDKLRESFYANFDEKQSDIDRFAPMFKEMANKLSVLKIDYSFVDVSRKKSMIDFNLNLEEGIFLSVAKSIEESSEDVMFTIARNQKILVIDEMPLSDLVGRVVNVTKQLKSVELS